MTSWEEGVDLPRSIRRSGPAQVRGGGLEARDGFLPLRSPLLLFGENALLRKAGPLIFGEAFAFT